MGKILESEFRKELYKNLVDAGYTKEEAQKIVGTKYYAELHDNVKHGVDVILNNLIKEDFNETFDCEAINKNIEELKKLKELLK